MAMYERFCCCFDLRTGAIFSGLYVFVLSAIFLLKHAVWLRLLLVGQIHDNLEPFIDTLLRDKNYSSWNPTALNLTADLHRRNTASHVLHLLWSTGGIIASVILLVAVFKKLPLLFLPWLSWSSVNGVILLVNTIVDVLIWSYFRLYSSMNWFTVYGYANLPFMMYLLFVTASYYQTLESIYEGNSMKCCFPRACKRRLLHKVPSDVTPPSPTAQQAVQRWYQSTNENPEAGGGPAGALESSVQERLLMDNGVERAHEDDEEMGEANNRASRKDQEVGSKRKFKPPKIKVSQPSSDDDW